MQDPSYTYKKKKTQQNPSPPPSPPPPQPPPPHLYPWNEGTLPDICSRGLDTTVQATTCMSYAWKYMHDVQTAGDALVAGLKSELLASKETSSKLQQELTSLQVHT